LDTRVASTEGTGLQNRFLPNLMIFFPILDELKNLDFGGTRKNP
jgi:hypothetical protein